MTAAFRIAAGFLPLLDSALLIVAREAGFTAAEGIDLTLVRENSWAGVRDRIAVGHFEVAHMLAPMPVACNLGLSPLATEMVVPMALGLGGNAITVSQNVWRSMREHGAEPDLNPASAGAALRKAIIDGAKTGGDRLKFAVVHPHSGHNYELRYWLAASGVDPETDIEIVIVPPPLMADALAAGSIDGYCVGEPWNTAAVVKNVGHIVTVKEAIWKSSPEKVLGVAASWAAANPEKLAAFLRALYRAAEWCGASGNRRTLARILAQPHYVGTPSEWLLPALNGVIDVGGGTLVTGTDFFVPHARAATFPWKSHALWFYSQMVRWKQVPGRPASETIASDTYRPDLYREALKSLGVALPSANAKVEGALKAPTPVGSAGASLVLGPDGFFDGRIFDPGQIASYLAGSV